MHRNRLIRSAATLLLLIGAAACGGEPVAQEPTAGAPAATAAPLVTTSADYEPFNPGTFARPTTIDNEWFPMQPGTQYVYEGFTEEDGEQILHKVVFTITDLTKVVEGIRTVVIWDRDYSADVLGETELALFAQDDLGNIWHFGQYPEVYEEGKFIEAPAWIAGIEDARPGITLKAEPKLGGGSYSQGWGPAVSWTDRAQVAQVGQEVCVPLGCYKDVIVTEEFSREEPGAFQLKYYARGVGNIKVGWKGADATKESLELVAINKLTPEQLAEVRAEALKLEKRAYAVSKQVYALTAPSEPAGGQ